MTFTVLHDSMSHHVNSIEWDTDGDAQEALGLPSECSVPADVEPDEVADYLSDTYGFCVCSYCVDA